MVIDFLINKFRYDLTKMSKRNEWKLDKHERQHKQ